MKILFLIPQHPSHFRKERYSLGVSSIAAVLKQAGHDVKVAGLSHFNRKDLDVLVRSWGPDMVGVSLATDALSLAKRVVRRIGGRHRIPVVIGGAHAKADPEGTILLKGVFAVCTGEGEEAMLELCERMERGGQALDIPGMWLHENGRVVRNPVRPPVSDLDALPDPDRSWTALKKVSAGTLRLIGLHDEGAPITGPQGSNQPVLDSGGSGRRIYEADFMAGRGCPFNCPYCYASNEKERYKGLGPYVRLRSVGRVIDEISTVDTSSPLALIQFHDDILAWNRRWFGEFARAFPRRFTGRFTCNMKADLLDEALVRQHREAGCAFACIGVETGSPRLRREIMGREMSNEQIENAFRWCRKAGLYSLAFIMLGVPGETPETLFDTIELTKRLDPDMVYCSIFTPYPGTALYSMCQRNGWIGRRRHRGSFTEPSILRLPTVKPEEIGQAQRRILELGRLSGGD